MELFTKIYLHGNDSCTEEGKKEKGSSEKRLRGSGGRGAKVVEEKGKTGSKGKACCIFERV